MWRVNAHVLTGGMSCGGFHRVWNNNFKPGIELIEQEQMADKVREEESLAQASFAQQAQTDWSVEAVVDEDDLFK